MNFAKAGYGGAEPMVEENSGVSDYQHLLQPLEKNMVLIHTHTSQK